MKKRNFFMILLLCAIGGGLIGLDACYQVANGFLCLMWLLVAAVVAIWCTISAIRG